MKKWILLIIGVVIISLVMGVIATRSEAFRYATEWAKRSLEVRQMLGEITDVGFLPKHYSVGSTSSYEYARFAFSVTGTKGKATVDIQLQKDSGNWRVLSAKLNETELSKLE
ncbi:MAG: cytochrome c oxidase assembly factor Coa1 family protein [Sulfuricaulis sp.]|uniref:cytochrome c oxidase assembly factor Coa1 family protein n=1 Tax=Sulfuricaulis sp. TaxID=2003553 RepID=UPI003C33824B